LDADSWGVGFVGWIGCLVEEGKMKILLNNKGYFDH